MALLSVYSLEERFSDDAKFTWSYLDEQRVRANELKLLGQEEAGKEWRVLLALPNENFYYSSFARAISGC